MRLTHGSIQKSLNLHLLAADSVSFVPMKLNAADVPMFRSHRGNAFELSPSARAELATETHDIVDLASYDNHFDIAYLPNKLKTRSPHPGERI
jgi:hypothetical protein